MSVFTSRVTQILTDIPGAPGRTATIRKLNGKRLAKAAMASYAEAVATLQAIGGAAVAKEMDALGGEAAIKARAAAAASAPVNPLQGYDPHELVVQGATAWDLEVALSRDAIEDLDDAALTYLATAVLALAKPVRTEADTKNS